MDMREGFVLTEERRISSGAKTTFGKMRGEMVEPKPTDESRTSQADKEIRRLNEALSSRDLALASSIAERTRLNEELSALNAEFNELQSRVGKVGHSSNWRLFDGLIHFPRTIGRLSRWPFARMAFHKNGRPRYWGRWPAVNSNGRSRGSQVPTRSLFQVRIGGNTGHPAGRPIKDAPRLWFYIEDTIDWLQAHSQLTGVGRVSTELFFASQAISSSRVWPCVLGKGVSLVLKLASAEDLKFIGDKTGHAAALGALKSGADSSSGVSSPEPGDHVFFTGLVWTPTLVKLFAKLTTQDIDFSVLVYDIIPIECPEFVGDEYSLSFSVWLTTTVKTANVIYVSTTGVRDRIIRWALLSGLEIKPRIVPIAFGHSRIEGGLSAPEIARDARTTKIDIGNFVLSVGTIDLRKNQTLLCRIWKGLADSLGADNIPQLVLVGRDDIGIASANPAASPLFAADRIVLLSGLADDQVAGLYKACLFTAFPSLEEGYGLPVAESLQYGKLCISSSLPAVREHAGDLVWYFRPDDFDEALGLFVRAIERPADREKTEARIAREFRPLRWGDTYQTMVAAARQALQEPVQRFEPRYGREDIGGTGPIDLKLALRNASRWCTADEPEVSILVVNWNAASVTLECIRQIWRHTEGYKYEMIVVDNGSSEVDLRRLRNLGGGVRLLELGCNRYFGEANNIAAEAASGRYLCLLNNDAFVQPGWLGELIEPLANNSAIGATGPLFLFPNGTIQEAGAGINDGGYPIRFGRGNGLDAAGTLQPKVVDYTSGATFLIPRDLFLQAGGFDLAYEPSYYEDTDLCFKVQALGRKILFCPQSKVVRAEVWRAKDDPGVGARRTALGELNRGKFVARWGKYLKTRHTQELAALRESLALDASPSAFRAPTDPEKTAALYTPFELTPGGGERYLLTAASVLSRQYKVTLVTPHPYSLIRLRNLGRELGIDLSRLRAMPEGVFLQRPQPDLMLTLGNHVIPPAVGRGKVNIFICQFPFRMGSEPTEEERTRLLGYDAILVYSHYTSAHVHAALSAFQLPKINVKVLNPPVQMIAHDCPKKKRIILSVGRFFVGGHSKRHDALITAFKSICGQSGQPIELHLAGSSRPSKEHLDYLASLQSSAEGYPIHFHVNCSPQELVQLYCDASVYWHGTGIGANLIEEPDKAEHFGISLVEAMSAQAVPFALNSGGPREIITDGQTGFLYRSVDDLKALTTEILSDSGRPHAQRIMLAASIRARDFSVENFERGFETLVDEMTKAKAVGA